MISRERVRKVLNHDKSDCLPFGLGGCETAGMHLLTYKRLNEILALDYIVPRLNTFMFNAVFEIETLQAMQADIILLASPRMCTAPLWYDQGKSWKIEELWGNKIKAASSEKFETKQDGSVIWNDSIKAPSGTYYFDSDVATDLYANITYPDPYLFEPARSMDDSWLRSLENIAKRLYEETGFSICCGETITDLQIQPGGYIGHLILMDEDPQMMHAYLSKCTEAAISQLKEVDQAIGKYADMLCIAHDFGDNRGVTIGAERWREIYQPHYKKLFSQWHQITKMKVNMHSCGQISEILPDLIECGMDIYNPVQINDLELLKQLKIKYGDKLVFYGGDYNAQQLPITAEYEEVFTHVSERIKILGYDGGHIIAGVHNLPADMPEQHIRAFLDAVSQYR